MMVLSIISFLADVRKPIVSQWFVEVFDGVLRYFISGTRSQNKCSPLVFQGFRETMQRHYSFLGTRSGNAGKPLFELGFRSLSQKNPIVWAGLA